MPLSETPRAPLALRVQGARRQLGGRAVLRDVALEVPRGALVLLAGPNGAGKSSLLRAIAGRLALEAGEIAIDGQPAAMARATGRLGVVPQDVALDPHLSVRENLRLWARLAGVPPASVRAAVDDGLEWAGLSSRADASVGALSGGMRRRVNLLAGLLHRPALLLLDEPTAGLDQASRAQFGALVQGLRHQDVAVLLVTHELDELGEACDALAVMRDGAILAHDAPGPLVDRFGSSLGDVVVGLADDAAPAQQQLLRRAGFRPRGPRAWVRPGAVAELVAVQLAVEQAGLRVDAVQWRRPTVQAAVDAIVAAGGGPDA